jgi:hypothetical protein
MKIEINDHRKIFFLQEEFNKLFPRLKIEVQAKPNTAGGSPSNKIQKPSKTIGESRIKHATGEVTITPSMTAADLKQVLSDKYGLSVAIFRMAGTQWVETTNNNKLSLQEQNEETKL